MPIEVSNDAQDFIRERGGRAFVWVGGSGLLHISTAAPSQTEEWHRCEQAEGVEVNIAASALAASSWRIRLLHMPWKRLDVTTNLTVGIHPSVPGPG